MPVTGPVAAIVARAQQMPTWLRYVGTIAIVAGTFLVRRVLDPVLPEGYPFLLFFIAILLSASVFDRGSGFLATGLSAFLAAYFYLPPLDDGTGANVRHAVALLLFVAIGITMALIIEALHKAVADLRRSENARVLLLNEFRHRTRNDLQSLVGILRLRARTAPSDTAREGLHEAADHAMALARVHTRLAQDGGSERDDPSTTCVREFIAGLCADLKAAQFGDELRPVALIVEAEPHLLPTERSVQLGLVLNETVTNALKYAFPEGRAGTVWVRFVREGEDFVLIVSDDGIGLPQEGELTERRPRRGSGLGTRLLAALAAQLRGTFTRRAGEGGIGTVAELRFPAMSR
jgi:two-component sensor histidine kinase